MKSLSFVAPALFFSALALPAQTATYTTFGAGCASSVSSCPSSNAAMVSPVTTTHNTNIFAHPVDPKTSLVVLGFSYYNKSVGSTPVTIKTELYKADSAGKPLNPAFATSTMVVTTTQGWHSTVFKTPIVIKPNERFFISHLGGNQVTWSWDNAGVKSLHYWHSPSATTWNGPFTSVNWGWKVNCAGGKTVTTLSNTGVPKLANSFSVDLSQALPNTGAALFIGGSNTKFLTLNLPFALTAFGAPNCSLNVSVDVVVPTAVGAQGSAQVKFGVPNNKSLLGVNFHNQFMVLDKAANNMGFSFSNGGTGLIGN